MEIISTKTKTYVKGPVPGLKANEPKWYLLKSRSETGQTDPKASLSPQVTQYDKVGSEAVDGLPCEVYTVDKQAARQVMLSSGTLTEKELAEIVNIEMTYWFCSDGYIHRMRSRVDVRWPPNPSTTAIERIETHFYDYGAAITLQEPVGAEPLP